MQGRLADHEDQAAAFFEGDVGCAHDQVGADAVRNRRHGVDGTGRHHHGIHRGRSAGQAAADVLDRVVEVGQGFEIRCGFSHFEEGGAFAGARHDEVRLHGGLGAQFFEQAPAVDGTAGSGDAYDDAQVT